MNSINKIRKKIAFTALIGLLLVVIWIVLTILTIPTGTIQEQLISLENDSTLYKWSFFNASLISIPMSTLIILFSAIYHERRNILDTLSVFLLAPYVVLVSIAYVSQYTLFPKLLNSDMNSSLVKIFYFYNRESMVYFMDLLGYVFLSLSVFPLGFKFLLSKERARKAAGFILLLMAFSAVIGFVGYAIDNVVIEQGITISGVFSIILFFFVSTSAKRLAQEF